MANKVGRPAKITLQYVLAVAELVAKGMPLKYAISLQDHPVKEPDYYKALRRKPEFAHVYARTIATRMNTALDAMWDGEDPKGIRRLPSLQFIMERAPIYRIDYGRGVDQPEVNVAVQVNGLPAEFVSRLREATRAKLAPPEKKLSFTNDVNKAINIEALTVESKAVNVDSKKG